MGICISYSVLMNGFLVIGGFPERKIEGNCESGIGLRVFALPNELNNGISLTLIAPAVEDLRIKSFLFNSKFVSCFLLSTDNLPSEQGKERKRAGSTIY